MPDSVDIIRQCAERWNAGDLEGMFELYHDDIVVMPGEHWPDSAVVEGKKAFRESTQEWLDVWQSIEIETTDVEAYGDRVVAHGAWRSTGRLSGIEGTLPIHIVFTVRGGRIARLEWFPDHERAVAAARGA
jgi:ketosteroid isomerase-like protein